MGYSIDGKIVSDFTLAEMACLATNNDTEPSLILTPEMVEFAQMMQEFRDWLKQPMKVSSWYRTHYINRKFGGSKSSVHLDGRACDIVFKDMTDEQFNKYMNKWLQICEKYNKIGGVNRYDWGMHFTNYEDKFGNKDFVIRDKRKNIDTKLTKHEKKLQKKEQCERRETRNKK